MKRALLLLSALAMLWVAVPPAAAQFTGTPGDVITQGTAYRTHHLPGERTVTVQLLGDIGATGIYVVGAQTDLLELLALAGGVPIGDPGPRARREYTVRLMRVADGGSRRDVVYEESLQTMLSEPGAYPTLRDGDVVTVGVTVRERIDLYRALQITSSLASMVLLALRLADAF